MYEMIWMFPILFIVHDMEEIIGFGYWLEKSSQLSNKIISKISKKLQPYSTEGMAAAVMEEMLICLAICIVTRCTDWYGLWLGSFVAYTIHLVIHMVQSISVKRYIPSVITSIICLPFSIWIIVKSIENLSYSPWQVLVYSLIGTAIVAGNLKLAHWIIHVVTNKFYSRKN